MSNTPDHTNKDGWKHEVSPWWYLGKFRCSACGEVVKNVKTNKSMKLFALLSCINQYCD